MAEAEEAPLSWRPQTAALILAAGIIVYFNALHTPFQFNDYFVVVNDRSIQDVSRLWEELPRSLRPLTKLSYALNYALGQLEPWGYHLVNLWFHLFIALEVFYLAAKILPNPAPFWTALLFTVHPIQTETVTYIAARSNVMMAFFYLSGLIAATRALSLWRSVEDKRSKALAWLGLALICYLAAIASKEAAVTLPLAVLVYDLYFLRGARNRVRRKTLLYTSLCLLAIGVLSLFIFHARYVELFRNIFATLAARSSSTHILTQPVILVSLLRRFFIPVDLNIDFDYQLVSTLDLKAVFSLSLLSLLVVLAFFLFRRLSVFSFAIAWFFVTLLPHILLPRTDFLNERHLYLPSVGMIMGLTYLIFQVKAKAASNLALGLICLLLAVGTIQRNSVYADELTLWEDTVAKSPNKARPHNNLGYIYLKRGDSEKAALEFNRALELNPAFTKASLNLGYVYLLQGDVESARRVYLKALAYDPASADLRKALVEASARASGGS